MHSSDFSTLDRIVTLQFHSSQNVVCHMVVALKQVLSNECVYLCNNATDDFQRRLANCLNEHDHPTNNKTSFRKFGKFPFYALKTRLQCQVVSSLS